MVKLHLKTAKPKTKKNMKIKLIAVYPTLLLASSLWLNAVEKASSSAPSSASEGQAKPSSAEFERMKTLVGTWIGKTDMGQGPVDLTLQYRLLAGGSVLEERCFVGTPNEMITMYYDQNGKLAMTHYCMFGNRPGMLLKSSDAKTIKLDFDTTCGIDPKKESHMHALTISFDDADSITTRCKAILDGKEAPDHATTLKRVK
jgi:hypothetical protein